LRRTDAVRFALETITRASAGAVLVVDDGGVLCGYLTDGDVRRHLLRAPDASALLRRPLKN
jgi:CBS domain-containing protein